MGPIEVDLWDTAGQDDYARLRPIAYPDANVFLLCFAIDLETSFMNITSKWIPELRYYSKAPIVLVGLKMDRRGEDGVDCVDIREV